MAAINDNRKECNGYGTTFLGGRVMDDYSKKSYESDNSDKYMSAIEMFERWLNEVEPCKRTDVAESYKRTVYIMTPRLKWIPGWFKFGSKLFFLNHIFYKIQTLYGCYPASTSWDEGVYTINFESKENSGDTDESI